VSCLTLSHIPWHRLLHIRSRWRYSERKIVCFQWCWSRIAHPTSAETPQKLWLTDDGAAIVATGPCEDGSDTLCGIIVGLPGAATDPEVKAARSQLCELPLIWEMKPAHGRGNWAKGRLLDPESGRGYPATFSDQGARALIQIGSMTLTWTKARSVTEPCK
jgi:uncharacterized protein (DUF2147 family)